MERATDNFKLIVGLGNPGKEYAATRHNIGFMAVDQLLTSLPGEWEKIDKYKSIFHAGKFRGRKLFIQKPMTYMNLSGGAVRALAEANKIAVQEILVIYDDMDLDLGKMRIRRAGSAGGHHGIESLISELGSDRFARVRIGIGRGEKGVDHVLGEFSAEEKKMVEEVVAAAAAAAKMALQHGLTATMNRYNGFAAPPAVREDTEKVEQED